VVVKPNAIFKMTHQDRLQEVANAPKDNNPHGPPSRQAHGPGGEHPKVKEQDAESRRQGGRREEDLKWEEEL
jgi:hypothetical protein